MYISRLTVNGAQELLVLLSLRRENEGRKREINVNYWLLNVEVRCVVFGNVV